LEAEAVVAEVVKFSRKILFNSNLNYFLLGVFITTLNTPLVDTSTFLILSLGLFIYFIIMLSLYFKKTKESKIPRLQFRKTKEQKQLAKLKKKRLIKAEKKHEMINNQFTYIQNIWVLSREQQKIFVSFIDKKAYTDLYTKMTASLLPQLIKMIDLCIEKNKKGCKRDVNRRINELIVIMKDEINRKRDKKIEDFESVSQVYDHLINELK
jgi:hypothetical protein